MTLLNGLLAFGAIAFTVPLAIHLLFRSRFRTIDWGAMHLLEGVVRINRRRIQLAHLLLLLLRCLLPILLAICLARPVLTGFRTLPGDAPQSLVLVLDDSRSMSVRDEQGVARIDRAKQAVTDLLSNLTRRDELIFLRSSRIDAASGTMGAQEASNRVRKMTAGGGPVDLARMLRAAVDASQAASLDQIQILVVSDFQSHLLSDAAIELIRRLAPSLAEKSKRPAISLLNMGIDSQGLRNVSVESVRVDSPAVVAGRNAKFSARLRNGSDTPVGDLRLTWSLDGKPLSTRVVSIPPRASVTARLGRQIQEPGVHQLGVSIEHGDAMLEDNQRSIGVDVIREIDVLIVDGDPSNRPLEGESDFLAIALSPFAFGGQDQPDAAGVSVVSKTQVAVEIQQWRNASGESKPDIVVLANVDQVDEASRRSLSQFVHDGGALIVFDGDSIKPEWYNAPWSFEGGQWNLPASLGEFVGSPARRDAAPLPIGQLNPLYSPWNVLGAADQQPFDRVDIYGYRKLTLRASEVNANESVTAPDVSAIDRDDVAGEAAAAELLQMASGDPIVVSARRGGGHVVQLAVSCDADWTTLPMRAVFVPMIQQMVLDLAGSRKQTTVPVGNAISVPIKELTASITEDSRLRQPKTPIYTLETPSGSEAVLQPTDGQPPQLRLRSTETAGVYRFRRTTPLANGDQALVTNTIRVVEVPTVESQLRDVDPARLSQTAESIGASIYADIESFQSDDQSRRHGREIWRWLWMALLIAMIGELLLQQRSLARTSVVGAT